jgi:hypothetical protein
MFRIVLESVWDFQASPVANFQSCINIQIILKYKLLI